MSIAGPDHRVAPLPCPNCGELLDGATHIDLDGKPDPVAVPELDSLSVCLECSQMLIMRAGGWAKIDKRLYRSLHRSERRTLATLVHANKRARRMS